MSLPKGFRKLEDGFLVYDPSIEKARFGYVDPGVAIKVLRRDAAGKLTHVPGCSERCFGTFKSFPCGKPPKFDPDKRGRMTKCGHHSAAAKQRKIDKRDARIAGWHAKWDRERAIETARGKIEPALRQIAAGHNDPRGLATEVIAALDAALAGGKDD